MSIQFYETALGRRFYEGTMPAAVNAVEKIAAQLKRYNDNVTKWDDAEPRPSGPLPLMEQAGKAHGPVQCGNTLLPHGKALTKLEHTALSAKCIEDVEEMYKVFCQNEPCTDFTPGGDFIDFIAFLTKNLDTVRELLLSVPPAASTG